jgi:hypothetical protein
LAQVKKFGKTTETAAAASIEEDTENKKALEEILRQKAFLERSVPGKNASHKTDDFFTLSMMSQDLRLR